MKIPISILFLAFSLFFSACQSDDSAQAHLQMETEAPPMASVEAVAQVDSAYIPQLPFSYPVNPPVPFKGKIYTSVQEAIEAAEPGDTLLLPRGIYNEPVHILDKKNLTLIGQEAPVYVYIPVNDIPVILVENSEGICLKNLMLRHDAPPGSCKGEYGHTLSLKNSANIQLEHCYLNGSGYYGIYGEGIAQKLALRDCILEECYLDLVYLTQNPQLDSLVLQANLFSNPLGIRIEQSKLSYLELRDNQFATEIYSPLLEHIFQASDGLESVIENNDFQRTVIPQSFSSSLLESNRFSGSEGETASSPTRLDSSNWDWTWKPDTAMVHMGFDSVAIYPWIQQGRVDITAWTSRPEWEFFIPGDFESCPDWLYGDPAVWGICRQSLIPIKIELDTTRESSCEEDSITWTHVSSPCGSPVYFRESPFTEGPIPVVGVKGGLNSWEFDLDNEKSYLRIVSGQYAEGQWYGEPCSYDFFLFSHGRARHLHHFASNPRYQELPDLLWAGDINRDGEVDLLLDLGGGEGQRQIGLFVSYFDEESQQIKYDWTALQIDQSIC